MPEVDLRGGAAWELVEEGQFRVPGAELIGILTGEVQSGMANPPGYSVRVLRAQTGLATAAGGSARRNSPAS